jgi:hypothetical protein
VRESLGRRISMLEQRRSNGSSRRPRISAERRKALTDRAVLQGDLEALQELSVYRSDKITASKEQRAAAIAAALRGDL